MDGIRMPARTRAFIGFMTALTLVVIGFVLWSQLWTTYQWYRDLDAASVFVTRIVSKGTLWLCATLIASATLYTSALMAGRYVIRNRWFNPVALVSSVVLGTLMGWSLSANWITFRLAVAQSPFGIRDPLFGRDVGLFVFTLPALEIAATWLGGLLAIAFIVIAAVVLIPEVTGADRAVPDKWARVQSLLTALFGFGMLFTAFSRWLDVWRLEYSSHAQFVGASFTDAHALLPAKWVLVVASVGVALVMFATARSRRWAWQASALVVWGLAAVILGSWWPGLMQAYVVAPNEAKLEAPYIRRNIDMTRAAFDLADTTSRHLQPVESLTPSAAANAVEALGSARIWSRSSVTQAYTQLQTIRPYYRLSTPETDRYELDGSRQQVLVSAREIDVDSLPTRARTWVNQHLVYTHGYGLTIGSTSRTTPRGFPQFLVGDIPPHVASAAAGTSPSLDTEEPRIYFGTNESEYAIIHTGIDEFDYPSGDKNATYFNTSGAGIRLGSGLDRLAWAVRLHSDQVVFSDYLNADSRVLLDRDVVTRATRLAPWLEYPEDPYPALVDGRIVWILDGFTSSDHYPCSQCLSDGTNYLRDSVKVTVDAFTGDTALYAIGDDPIRDAWARIFPRLIRPQTEIPSALAEHFRYPRTLFAAQTEIFRAYHMDDARVFYNKEDQWQLSRMSGKPVRSSYVSLRLPDTEESGMYLAQPFTPEGEDNLVGWMVAGCDPGSYGEQTVYLMPKDRVILGPQQVRSRINQDPAISPQLALWNQRGSKVIFGDMLIAPVQGSVVYIQPIFLRAKSAALTELAAVIVVSGDRIEMSGTLSEALANAFGTGDGDLISQGGTDLDVLLTRALAAERAGDAAAYKAALDELVETVEDLEGRAAAPVY